MRKLFSIKIANLGLNNLHNKISNRPPDETLDYGTYDVELQDNVLSGYFWTREKIIILDELDIHASAEPVTIHKVNRFTFTLRRIKDFDYLLNIESSSKSIKPLIRHLQNITETKVYISQIEISLTDFVDHLEKENMPLLKATHAYATNQTISNSEKITFSIYSSENAITAAQTIINNKNLKFDRIRLHTSNQGRSVTLDIKSNGLYSASEAKSDIEKEMIAYVLKTQAHN